MRTLQTLELQSVNGGLTNSTSAIPPEPFIPVIIEWLKDPKLRDIALVGIGIMIGIGAEYVKCTTC